MKLKFPSGKVGFEICCITGMDDPKGHLLERPAIVQNMSGKCIPGKVADFTNEEITQLCKEVEYVMDIKRDHIEDDKENRKYNWTSLHQYRLGQFWKKLNQLT